MCEEGDTVAISAGLGASSPPDPWDPITAMAHLFQTLKGMLHALNRDIFSIFDGLSPQNLQEMEQMYGVEDDRTLDAYTAEVVPQEQTWESLFLEAKKRRSHDITTNL